MTKDRKDEEAHEREIGRGRVMTPSKTSDEVADQIARDKMQSALPGLGEKKPARPTLPPVGGGYGRERGYVSGETDLFGETTPGRRARMAAQQGRGIPGEPRARPQATPEQRRAMALLDVLVEDVVRELEANGFLPHSLGTRGLFLDGLRAMVLRYCYYDANFAEALVVSGTPHDEDDLDDGGMG